MTIPLEKLLNNESNRYRLVLMAARRGNDIISSSANQEMPTKRKITSMVLDEIASEKVHIEYQDEKKKGKK